MVESDPDVRKKELSGTDKLNDVFSTLVGDEMLPLYFDTYNDELRQRKLSGFTTHFVKFNRTRDDKSDQSWRKISRRMAKDYIMRDLFLWSILMNYIDMSKVLLSHMKYRICASLIATKILKSYSRLATYDEIKKIYKENADYFENYAIDCVNLCQKNNSEQATEIILRQIELFGNVTCLQVCFTFRLFFYILFRINSKIAANADDKRFISHSCCVQAISNVWYDKLYPDQSKKRNRAALIVSFISFGLLAPLFVDYRKVPKVKNKHPSNNIDLIIVLFQENYKLFFNDESVEKT